MHVLGRDAVGELVEVRLADVRVPALLQPCDRLGRPLRDVVGEDDRPGGVLVSDQDWQNDPSHNPELARRNLIWGWSLFALFWALFAGTVVVAMLYLAVSD